jgi:hypothetical protein
MSGVIPTHAMHTAPRRGGRRANVEAIVWRGVRGQARDRAREQLKDVLHAAVHITANIVGVVRLKLTGIDGVGVENDVAETGRKTLYLCDDAL